MRRRQFLSSAALLVPAGCASTGARVAAAPSFEASCARLEREHGGRLGAAVVDVGTGRRAAWRPDERFPLCSTFKALLAGAVLARVDRGECALDEPVRFGRADLVSYSPVVEEAVERGAMTIDELCRATVTVSDNAAANLLLARIGGPPALTAYVRSLGDSVTRLDRIEPALNDVGPGDVRDTTSPGAMLQTLRHLFLGQALSPASRERLTAWHLATFTGPARLKAGLPAGWRLAHKTGSGAEATNDVGIAWPPAGNPLIIAAYYVAPKASLPVREGVLAQVGRLAAAFQSGAVAS